MTRRKVLVEAIVFAVLGVMSVIEGIRLTLNVRPHGTYDIFGPDRYQLLVGMALLVTGTIHFILERGDSSVPSLPPRPAENPSQGFRRRAFGSVFAMIVYASLIDVLGYLASTTLFFFVIFWFTELTRSWLLGILLSIGCAAIFDLVFVHLLGVVFPRGSLIEIGI